MKSLKLTRKHKILLSALEKNPQPLTKLDDKGQELAQQLLRAGFLEEAGGKLKVIPKQVEEVEPEQETPVEPAPRGESAVVAHADEATYAAPPVAVLAPKEGAATRQTTSFVPVYDQAVAKQPTQELVRHRTEHTPSRTPPQRTTWTPGGRR